MKIVIISLSNTDVEQAKAVRLDLEDPSQVYVEEHRLNSDHVMNIDSLVDDDKAVCNPERFDTSYDRERHPMTKHLPSMNVLLFDLPWHLLLQVLNNTMYRYYRLYFRNHRD